MYTDEVPEIKMLKDDAEEFTKRVVVMVKGRDHTGTEIKKGRI